jgi:hypothetical protein
MIGTLTRILVDYLDGLICKMRRHNGAKTVHVGYNTGKPIFMCGSCGRIVE